ncbi:MAG: hypothetical protein ACFE7R_05220 [Candidatus Hodarchaeota archaeon]
MPDSEDILLVIKKIERTIEDTLWNSMNDEDYEKARQEYEKAKLDLESMQGLTDNLERERKRVLSYSLMRLNDAMGHLGMSNGSIERAEEALQLAEESKDLVQTLRAKLAVGVTLLNQGRLPEAESYFEDIIFQTQDETENEEVIQVFGWTLIVRVNILLGKSLYNQAEALALQALGVLSRIKNYAGLRTACSLLSRVYQSLGDLEKADSYRQRSEEYAKLAKKHRQ